MKKLLFILVLLSAFALTACSGGPTDFGWVKYQVPEGYTQVNDLVQCATISVSADTDPLNYKLDEKTIRIMQARQNLQMDPNVVNTTNVLDIELVDNKGQVRKLTDLKGKVVLLDFHIFATEDSPKRIMQLREYYNKYHDRGLDIYQVSVDENEHFWKQQTAALPWVNVYDQAGLNSENLVRFNVLDIPTFFLVDRNSTLYKRDAQIKDLDAEIQKLL